MVFCLISNSASAGKFSTKRTFDALPSGSPLAAEANSLKKKQAQKMGGKTLFSGGIVRNTPGFYPPVSLLHLRCSLQRHRFTPGGKFPSVAPARMRCRLWPQGWGLSVKSKIYVKNNPMRICGGMTLLITFNHLKRLFQNPWICSSTSMSSNTSFGFALKASTASFGKCSTVVISSLRYLNLLSQAPGATLLGGTRAGVVFGLSMKLVGTKQVVR